ncbi:MAG: phosphatidylserine decarboxylase [Thermodesulfobacteriota bacterium]
MHQYVERASNLVMTEELFGDRIVNFLYSKTRERAPRLFDLVTSGRVSSLLGFCNFDLPLAANLLGNQRFLARCGVNLSECLEPAAFFTTARRIFERRIRYWQCRPMPEAPDSVVSPADARVLIGSLDQEAPLFVKDKFFHYQELFGPGQGNWLAAFRGGDFAIFRLTPDKYHYNHAPVSGRVVAFFEVSGCYHSCNPGAVVEVVTPYSRNKRVVTILNTDVPGGSQVGLVAMVEVVALMIGEVVQCYSDYRYELPTRVRPGMFLRRGQPKSMYRPGSSTDILLFQQGRVRFAEDLLAQRRRGDVVSRFSLGFGEIMTESDIRVRSLLAHPCRRAMAPVGGCAGS